MAVVKISERGSFRKEYIRWWKHPEKDIQLFDWLDENERERKTLFSPGYLRDRRNPLPYGLTKMECGLRAAAALFAGDPQRGQDYAANPRRFSMSVHDHIRSLRFKYRRFNSKIGAKVSNMAYVDIQGPLLQKIDQLMLVECPEWIRLHFHWRTDPYYNQYWPKDQPTAREKPVQANAPERQLRKSSPGLVNQKRALQASAVRVRDGQNKANSPVMELPTPRENSNSGTTQVRSSSTTQEIETLASEGGHASVIHGGATNLDGSITSIQRLELLIQLRKLDIEREDKKYAAELQRAQVEAANRHQSEKHEIMKQLADYVTGGKGSTGGSSTGRDE
ncbi:hypothetical protein HYPSUDRAFT_561640 [Hypholoma sublateritium FD-334 SS-4]|uniref:No apical meristem-associated C-terminal domain-containing protein n=1 Tax=Hypholoma sublateritium (strain FD-334 SS-4) TaxID=945553 RepID=A0A0D2P5D9_HYPSF|nr:hypothetical protein HYPSUDRAFT_561640 [Hypholoma sublateritium FD-334 SS-4]